MDVITLLSLDNVVASLATTLIHFCWQAALIALALKVFLSLSNKQALKFRYFAAVTALLACVVLPAYTFTSTLQNAHKNISATATEGGRTVGLIPELKQELSALTSVSNESSLIESVAHYLDGGALVALWAFGVLFMFVKLIYDLYQTYQLTRVGVSRVDDDILHMVENISHTFAIKQRVKVLKSSLVNVPVVIGWFKPTVLLPIAITIGLDRQQLELIIAHELAHVKRLDFLVNLAQGVIQVAFFFHPCVYWINKVVREEREYICDSMALATLANRPEARLELAKALLNIEELKEGNLSLVAVAASDGHLKNRINRIVMNERLRLPSAKGVLVALMGLIFSFTAIAVTSDISNDKQKDQVVIEPIPQTQFVDSDRLSQSQLRRRSEQETQADDKQLSASGIKTEPEVESVQLEITQTKAVFKQPQSEAIKKKTVDNKKSNIQMSSKSTIVDEPTEPKLKNMLHQDKLLVSQSKTSEVTSSMQKSPSQQADNVAQKPVTSNSMETAKVASTLDKSALLQESSEVVSGKLAEQKQPTKSGVDNANASIVEANAKPPKSIQRVALLDAKKVPNFREPKAIKTPYPSYPAGAYKNKLSGKVKVDFVINEEGRVIDTEFERGTPYIFVKEIRAKLKRWRYQPALKGGDTVAYQSSIFFEFELPDEAPLTQYEVGSRIKRRIR